jgi:hypothetical protein
MITTRRHMHHRRIRGLQRAAFATLCVVCSVRRGLPRGRTAAITVLDAVKASAATAAVDDRWQPADLTFYLNLVLTCGSLWAASSD